MNHKLSRILEQLHLSILTFAMVVFTGSAVAAAPFGDVLVTKTVLETSYIPGQSLTYTIQVVNNGPDQISGLVVNDVFSADFAAYVYNVQQAVGATVVSGGSGQGNAQPGSPGTLSAVLDLSNGGVVEFTVNAVVRLGVTTNPLNNTASLSFTGTGGYSDTNAGNNSATIGLAPGGTGGTGVGSPLCANLPSTVPLSVTTADTVLNTYFTPAASGPVAISTGSRCLPVIGAGIGAAPTALSSIDVGQKLLVVQMQDGASMTVTDNAAYGTGIGNIGVYEYVEVRGMVGTGGCSAGEIPITGSSGSPGGLGLANSYTHNPTAVPKQVTQYVRVPQHTDITLSGAGTLAALPWNGTRGGVIAADASGTFDLGVNSVGVDASCSGYRGGGRLNFAVASGLDRGPSIFRRTIAIGNGVKGEGFSGTSRLVFDGISVVDLTGADGYTNGATGKGAPGSAGGGGNACSSVTGGPPPNNETGGGGGGGNGGRGGSGGTCNTNAVTGASSANTGGVEGRVFQGFTFNGVALAGSTELPEGVGRITMGPGGGAAASNGSAGIEGSGGLGGGIILLSANTFTGTADIVSNGCDGQAGSAASGGGGGGAGGTIVLLTNLAGSTTYSSVQVRVNGGNGGNAGVGNGNADLRGPGGGGGAGRTYISRIANNGSAPVTASGGLSGVTDFTPANQSQTYNAVSGNNYNEQSNLNAYNSVPGAKPQFICVGGTVPVTLSNVDVKEIDSDLVVNFNTASEAGTLGFRVLADIGKGVQARVEIGSVASKAIDSLKEQSYSVRARNPGADQVWIEESAVDGKSTLYGPYKVGSAVGEVGLAQPLNWAAVNAEQLSFRAAQSAALRGISAKAAEIRVNSDGWVRVTQAQLVAAGVDLSGQPANNIAVRLGSSTVPARVNLGAKAFGPGSTIEFFAKAVKNSLYTTTAVYRIEIGRTLAQPEIDARTTGLSSGAEVLSAPGTQLLDSNTTYSFSSPLADPWFSFRALRSNNNPGGVGSLNFTIKDLSASVSAAETLTVNYWGGLDYSGVGQDHDAVFLLNGVRLGQVQFDGFAAGSQRFNLPVGALKLGNNTFTVQLPNSTGYANDIVNVESVQIDYVRNLIAVDDRLSVVLPATSAAAPAPVKGKAETITSSTFVINGLSGQPVAVLLERAGVSSLLNTDAISAGSLRIELNAQAGDQLTVVPVNNTLTPVAATPLVDPIAGGSASYLVISHPSFISNLGSFVLAKQSQGFTVKVVDVEAIYRYYSAGVVDPAAIQLAIRRAQSMLGTTHVLLVGGDTYDYQNVLGVNSVSFIPTNYRRSGPIIAFMPSDAVYADTDSDGMPNVAIGRWPVRTAAELNAIIAKTLTYQSTKKALFISDRSLNGVSYASEVAPVAALLNKDWTVNRLSLDSYASGQAATARADIVNALSQGVSLFSYYGHSAPASWSREGLITASQVNGGLVSPVNQSFATLQLGCWGTYFVEPTSTTVAQGLLLMPKGAALVLGASSLTASHSDIALANGILPRIADESFGQALMHTQQSIAAENPSAADVILGGTLLGDPSLR